MRRNETSFLSGVKSLNNLDNVLAREEARRRGADEAILLNTRGLVTEGSASNVFLVLDGRLVTPSLSSGCLAGITRQAVLELAAESGLEAIETDVERSAFAVASEAFLTGSVMEVMPLTRLDDRPVGSGRPGPVSGRLHSLYQEMVARETSAAPTSYGQNSVLAGRNALPTPSTGFYNGRDPSLPPCLCLLITNRSLR